jgi:hypothetical protein
MRLAGLGWAGLGWAGLDWAGLGWAGLQSLFPKRVPPVFGVFCGSLGFLTERSIGR